MKHVKILILLTLFMLVTPQCKAAKIDTGANSTIQYMNLNWWKNFNDSNLNDYLVEIYDNNHDLKIASIKSKQAQQAVKLAFANQLPQLYFDGNIQREFSGSTQRFGDVVIPDFNQARYYLPLTMSYEVDLWGENYLKTKSLKKKLQMTNEDERAAYISISSEFANDYFTLIGVDKLVKNQAELVDIEKNIVNLEEEKYKSGLCPISELLSERQTLARFQERYNLLKERQDILQNQLITLLGDRFQKNIKRSEFEALQLLPMPEDLPSEAISARPDMKKSELYIEKTGIDVKIARRDFLPKFRIYGQAGFNAYDWCRIFAPHTFMSAIGVAPSIDLFTGGYKKAKLKYNKLEYQKAIEMYEKTVLLSLQELNDAMMSVKTSNLNYNKASERYQIEIEKFELANNQYKIGAKSKLDNLKDSQVVLILEEELVTNKINCLISSINLYKAIGGKDYTEKL